MRSELEVDTQKDKQWNALFLDAAWYITSKGAFNNKPYLGCYIDILSKKEIDVR